MKLRQYLGSSAVALALAVVLIACGSPQAIRPGHTAGISCGSDGMVHASASQYNGGTYQVNSLEPVNFQGGFSFPLDGTKAWTLTVTANDWPTFTGSAGPCQQSSTTTTICVDCVPNTNIGGGSTTTTTGASTTTTSVCVDCVPNTNAATTTTTSCPTCVPPPPPPPSGSTTTSLVVPPPAVSTTTTRPDSTTTSIVRVTAPPPEGLPVTG